MRTDTQTQKVHSSDTRTYKRTRVLATSPGLTVPGHPKGKNLPTRNKVLLPISTLT